MSPAVTPSFHKRGERTVLTSRRGYCADSAQGLVSTFAVLGYLTLPGGLPQSLQRTSALKARISFPCFFAHSREQVHPPRKIRFKPMGCLHRMQKR